MRRTPQYLLQFYQAGDKYSASDDWDRDVVMDNQLYDLSRLVGDGVLIGWTVSHNPLDPPLMLRVSQGVGFIGGVVHKTLAEKTLTVADNSDNVVYMQSNILGVPGSFPPELEGPRSFPASAAYIHPNPPSVPTNFAAAAASFDSVRMQWDKNPEIDFDHYVIRRSLVNGPPWTVVATPKVNGTSAAPLVDSGLVGATAYYYQIAAVDTTGNQSDFSLGDATPYPVTTTFDSRKPADVTGLAAYAGNAAISVVFNRSATTDVVSEQVTVQRLKLDGSVDVSYDAINLATLPLPETLQVTQVRKLPGPWVPLDNGVRYRVIVQATRSNGNQSDGMSVEVTPVALPGPLDASGLAATAQPRAIKLSWTASASPAGSAMGQKSAYYARVIYNGAESAPRKDFGLGLYDPGTNTYSVVIDRYYMVAATGLGPPISLVDDQVYLFRLTTADSFGNESVGVFVKGSTVDTTPPTRPRALLATPGDSVVSLSWTHSASPDVVDYRASYSSNGGATWSADQSTGYGQAFDVLGLTDGTAYQFRLKAVDDAGNVSPYAMAAATPVADTTPPQVPDQIQLTASDRQVLAAWAQVPDADLDHYVVVRQGIVQPIDTPPNMPLTIIPGSEKTFYVGKDQDLVDVGLSNDIVYVYAIQSVDTHGNKSEFSANRLVQPGSAEDETFDPPTSLVVTATADLMRLDWQFSFPFQWELPPGVWHYPPGSGAPTNFNIYRSLHPYSGYALVASVDSSTRTYSESYLVGGTTYYYMVSAVRDQASPISDTGAIQPANSVRLAIVKTQGGGVLTITHDPRIIENLDATLTEQTLSRLLAHKHSVAPTNSLSVSATRTLGMIEFYSLATVDLTTLVALSPEALLYYQGLQALAKGATKPYEPDSAYVINPASLAWNVPFVGDFQAMVNAARPAGPFSVDEANNLIVFVTALEATDVVALDGLGYNFYVPSNLDLGGRGFGVIVDGAVNQDAEVDCLLQTVRFPQALGDNSAVSVLIEPVAADYGTQDGARQVSLSPNFVLNDFQGQNQITYTSASGAFESGDTVFVLVDGERTTLGYYVDFDAKSVVFKDPLPIGSVVSMEITGREEVTNQLPVSKLGGLDGSLFTTGQFLKAQLPALSHEGRVQEEADPLFQSLSTGENYVYSASGAAVGTATTPYSMLLTESATMILGTSSGMLRSFLPSLFLGATDDVNASVGAAIASSVFGSDQIVEAAQVAAQHSGKLAGSIQVGELDAPTYVSATRQRGRDPAYVIRPLTDGNFYVNSPCLTILEDGKILITGGVTSTDSSQVIDPKSYWWFESYYGESQPCTSNCGYAYGRAFIYDPSTGKTQEVEPMLSSRTFHAAVRLPSGFVLLSGGVDLTGNTCTDDASLYPNGTPPFRYLKSCEVFDLIGWAATGDMLEPRFNHACVSVPSAPQYVIAAGGASYHSFRAGQFVSTSWYDKLIWCDTQYYAMDTLRSAEVWHGAGTWTATGMLSVQSQEKDSKLDGANPVFDGTKTREVYSGSSGFSGAWSAAPQPPTVNSLAAASEIIDGPVKQLFVDSDDLLYAVTRNNVFVSPDEGLTFTKTSGLDATGVVHRVSEVGGTLFAATDLGVYEITYDIKSQMTWFQGGLIGAGTTETFDLQPYGTAMLAATEIGLYSSTDDGNTWTQVLGVDDVTSVRLLNSSTIILVSGQFLYRTTDDGVTWTRSGPFSFLDSSAILTPRNPSEVFLGTPTGLYRSTDFVTFSLVPFDQNKDQARNNVHMLALGGADLLVGYDNVVFSLDPALVATRVAEFAGVIPTVRVNGVEARSGFRFDTVRSQVVFEVKRLSQDVVDVAINYAVYQLVGGGWQAQNASAAVTVYVNKYVWPDSGLALDAWLGRVAFTEPLEKFDKVTVTVVGTTLRNEGEFFHEELEDRLEKEDALPLSLGRDNACDLLQMGLSTEHNFWEQGLERDQYYCLFANLVDRSFTAFLANSVFMILGRKDYDSFNSTIDYKPEAVQEQIGGAALACLSALEYAPDQLWIGTDSGIFVLDPTSVMAPFSVTRELVLGAEGNAVRSLAFALGDVYAASPGGIYDLQDDGMGGFNITRNAGNGLPSQTYVVQSMHNLLMAGTSDAFYYADSTTDPPYAIWLRASLVELDNVTEAVVTGDCSVMAINNGMAFGMVGKSLFTTTTGKVWRRVFSFAEDSGIAVNAMAFFSDKLYLATNQGTYCDGGTAVTDQVNLTLCLMEPTEAASAALFVNDLWGATADALYAVGSFPWLYALRNDRWTKAAIGSVAAQKVIVTSGGRKVLGSNNEIWTE